MTSADTERLRRRMGEAAPLPPDNAQRRAVEAEIAETDGWAEKEWLELLREDEQLRLELQRVPVPPGLEERLDAIPGQAPHSSASGLRRWFGLTAAALLIAVTGVLLYVNRMGAQAERLRSVAALSAEDHFEASELTVKTTERAAVATALSGEVPFKVKTPDLGQGFALLGARKCALDANAVILTRWERDGQTYSLYQFCPTDFDLPLKFRRRILTPEGTPSGGNSWQVLLWTEAGCAYALVSQEGATLPREYAELREYEEGVICVGAVCSF